MENDFLKTIRGIERERVHELWKLIKAGDTDDLTEEEQVLAQIMLEHEQEYGMHFEFTDAVLDYDYRDAGESNPFLHITYHAIVENQIASRNPKEVYQFYNAMRKKKLSRHETLHLIARILVPFILRTLKHAQEFDEKAYASQLRRFKLKRPSRVWTILDSDDK